MVYRYRRITFIRATQEKHIEDVELTETELLRHTGKNNVLAFLLLLNRWNVIASRYTERQNIYSYAALDL